MKDIVERCTVLSFYSFISLSLNLLAQREIQMISWSQDVTKKKMKSRKMNSIHPHCFLSVIYRGGRKEMRESTYIKKPHILISYMS